MKLKHNPILPLHIFAHSDQPSTSVWLPALIPASGRSSASAVPERGCPVDINRTRLSKTHRARSPNTLHAKTKIPSKGRWERPAAAKPRNHRLRREELALPVVPHLPLAGRAACSSHAACRLVVRSLNIGVAGIYSMAKVPFDISSLIRTCTFLRPARGFCGFVPLQPDSRAWRQR